MKKRKIQFAGLIPFVAFVIIFLVFTAASYNPRTGTFMMLQWRNLKTIITQSMINIVTACGTLFVMAQGSTDLSVGVNLALSGVVGMYAAYITHLDFLVFPVTLAVGALLGLLNGVLVARLKVSSFMVTLAMLIGIRGLVNYLQVYTDIQKVPAGLSFMQTDVFLIIFFVIICAAACYVFEFTRIGRYSRAIGENETTARAVGVPVNKIKILAFVLSGLMAGFGAIFYLGNIGATSNQMGSFLEIRVIMAVYLGGVLVTGGSTARFYKILLGSFSIQIILTGLALLGKADTEISQSTEGILLLLILAVSILAKNRKKKSAIH